MYILRRRNVFQRPDTVQAGCFSEIAIRGCLFPAPLGAQPVASILPRHGLHTRTLATAARSWYSRLDIEATVDWSHVDLVPSHC